MIFFCVHAPQSEQNNITAIKVSCKEHGLFDFEFHTGFSFQFIRTHIYSYVYIYIHPYRFVHDFVLYVSLFIFISHETITRGIKSCSCLSHRSIVRGSFFFKYPHIPTFIYMHVNTYRCIYMCMQMLRSYRQCAKRNVANDVNSGEFMGIIIDYECCTRYPYSEIPVFAPKINIRRNERNIRHNITSHYVS